jgi:S-adenosylmethionine:tRNA ribosyltransferase-isomerase
VRALEGAPAHAGAGDGPAGPRSKGGAVASGTGVTDLRIRPGFVPRVVDGLLTGTHEPGTSHFDVMAAFAPVALLERATGEAEAAGHQIHEFGDACLVLGR